MLIKRKRKYLYKKKICQRCGKKFIPESGHQKYCGSVKQKTGCSYLVDLERNREEERRNRSKRRPLKIRKCKICGEEFTSKYSRTLYCSKCDSSEYKKQRKREKERKKEKSCRLKLRFQIFQRDNFTCQYCGRKAPEVELQIDHKYPKSKGGLDKMKNYITACKECNLGKGDCILDEFK